MEELDQYTRIGVLELVDRREGIFTEGPRWWEAHDISLREAVAERIVRESGWYEGGEGGESYGRGY